MLNAEQALSAAEQAAAPDVFVVGVGGVSRSGKSSLSSALASAYHAPPPLCLDHYFHHYSALPRITLRRRKSPQHAEELVPALDWEQPHCIDLQALRSDLATAKRLVQRIALLQAQGKLPL